MKKILLFSILLVGFTHFAKSQMPEDTLIGISPFYIFQKDPICLDCAKQLIKNIKYPEQSKEDNITGNVWVEFTITKEMEIQNVTIIRSLWEECDTNVMIGVRKLKNLIPPIQSNQYIDAKLILKVSFINENNRFLVHVDNFFECDKKEYKKRIRKFKNKEI